MKKLRIMSEYNKVLTSEGSQKNMQQKAKTTKEDRDTQNILK